MSADTRLRAFIDRVLRLKAEQDELAADIREVYAEAKAEGFDKTAMGEVVSYLRRVDKRGADAIAEKQSIFDLYLQAYQGAAAAPSHAHAREGRASGSDYPTNSSEPNRVDCRLTNDERPAAAMAGGEGDASSPSAATDIEHPTVATSTGEPSGHLSEPSPDAVPATDGAREGAASSDGQSGQESGPSAAATASPPAGVNDGEGASVSSPSIPTYAPSPPAPPRPSDEDLAIPSFLRRGHPDCRFNDSQREPAQ